MVARFTLLPRKRPDRCCNKQYLYPISSSARSRTTGIIQLADCQTDYCQNTSLARAPKKTAVALPIVPGQITWTSGPKRMWSAMAMS